MSASDDATNSYEQGDDAIDEATRLDPNFIEELELDPSLDPNFQIDEKELEEASAALDDPEQIAVLDGLIDDPDGLGEQSPRTRSRAGDPEGWDLDAPIVPGDTGDAPLPEGERPDLS